MPDVKIFFINNSNNEFETTLMNHLINVLKKEGLSIFGGVHRNLGYITCTLEEKCYLAASSSICSSLPVL